MDVGVIPNVTLFIQAAIFLAFVFILNQLFVKPYMGVANERESIVKNNLKQAQELRQEAKTYVEEAQGILEKARKEANAILEEAKKEASKIRTEIIDKAEQEAQEEIEKSVSQIRASLEEEKRKMEGAIRDIAQTIVKKIIGEAA